MRRRLCLLVACGLLAACATASPAQNAARSQQFLSENARAEGVSATPSGLQYRVVTPVTNGARPRATDLVTVRYEGRFPNGRIFDSASEPVEFPLNRVIRGWTEGLQLMRPGETYEFYVPPALGYGERGTADGTIGPNQALIFRVELISVRGAP